MPRYSPDEPSERVALNLLLFLLFLLVCVARAMPVFKIEMEAS